MILSDGSLLLSFIQPFKTFRAFKNSYSVLLFDFGYKEMAQALLVDKENVHANRTVF